ncbi:hypothetical protein [Methylobacterium sp. Leaf123]|uniref:hypothetical protein n=1 Tax=Methylobacterium sp. Leaf123 TaxID=1736264 RepID=UPI0012E719D9|nr:hypothetical protein [Methylobacterium sp. Leaf123]
MFFGAHRYKGRYKVAVPMTSLSRASNGDWFARKGIPKDIRAAYKAAYGVAREERFRRPGSLSTGAAKAELRDWNATVTGRIEALRAATRGEGHGLTPREAHGLAGQWYAWFVARHEDEPEGVGEDIIERLEAARSWGSRHEDDEEETETQQRHRRGVTNEVGRVTTFLGEQGVNLTQEATDALLDIVERDLAAAAAALRRRAEGNYAPDPHAEKRPDFVPKRTAKVSGLTCWSLFEAWVFERKPGASTVNRWRAVFRGMEAHFEGRDIATITGEDAIAWKSTLVTPERTAGVVNDVWLRAARVAFGWARDNKRIPLNPFEGVSVTVGKAAPKVREREFLDEEWRIILNATTAGSEDRGHRGERADRPQRHRRGRCLAHRAEGRWRSGGRPFGRGLPHRGLAACPSGASGGGGCRDTPADYGALRSALRHPRHDHRHEQAEPVRALARGGKTDQPQHRP